MEEKKKSGVRRRANAIKPFRCKNVIAVLEDPTDIGNIGTVIRNVNALGIEKVYVVDQRGRLPGDWQDMRERRSLSKTSVSAVKWTFVKRFDTTQDCIDHLSTQNYRSVVTSPHVKGKENAYLDDVDFTPYPKLAVWFGNESRGVSEAAVANGELCVAIPMFGMIESLNLATSSGIVLYEVAKQRRAYQSRYKRANKKSERADPLPVVMEQEK